MEGFCMSSTFLLRFQEPVLPDAARPSTAAGTKTVTKSNNEGRDTDRSPMCSGTMTMTRQDCESADQDASASFAGTLTITEARGEGSDSDATSVLGTQTSTATVEEMDQDSPSAPFMALPIERQ